MHVILLIPGAEGSSLRLRNEDVWPPTLSEVIFGYDRIDKLIDDHVQATGVVHAIECFGVYRPLENDLAHIAQVTNATADAFYYDWRKDIDTVTVPALEQKIHDLVRAGATSITLVCHSMGCYVARLFLENATPTRTAPVKKYVAIGGPHHGATMPLVRALGLEGSLGMRAADVKRIMADHRYPAGYQCLPQPGVQAVYDEAAGQWLSIYDHTHCKRLGLDRRNVDRAASAYAKLDITRRPTHTEYFFIAGAGHTTDEWVIVNGAKVKTSTDQNGDGIVPLASAYSQEVRSYSTPADHIGIFTTYQFRKKLHEEFSVAFIAADTSGVAISLNKRVFAPGDEIGLTIVFEVETTNLSAKLVTHRMLGAKGDSPEPYGTPIAIDYRGPPIASLQVTINAPADFGAYRLNLEGTHRTAELTTTYFAVSQSGGRRDRL